MSDRVQAEGVENTLRLIQTYEGNDCYRVEVELKGTEFPEQVAVSRFGFKLSRQEQEDQRWYFEDYLQNPLDPAPAIAARIEKRLDKIGEELFQHIFTENVEAQNIWATLSNHLSDMRIEIASDIGESSTILWELLQEPQSHVPLALRVRAFVRTRKNQASSLRPSHPASGPIRILLVICRPTDESQPPFRSVAIHIVRSLSGSSDFYLEVLRPPTYNRMITQLNAARARGMPYHIVHFDGHGTYESPADWKPPCGLLHFEDDRRRKLFIDGKTLGKKLVTAGVSLLVLNACRSAYAEARTGPGSELSNDKSHAFSSLAEEVLEAGVTGVVAMRYNVYVVTAARFVATLYTALAQGSSPGDAVTQGRKQLTIEPQRELDYDLHTLQDWVVPIVYEATPISLLPRQSNAEQPHISVPTSNLNPPDMFDLPDPPEAGFVGYDEILLELERRLDHHNIVLLHGSAGSGKTAIAAEFGRWYAQTKGINGPVLFTSFEQHKPLKRILESVAQTFGEVLEQQGIHWQELSEEQQREQIQALLRQKPLLWIWDSVETTDDFPTTTVSTWSDIERQELQVFLQAAQNTRAKFVLTSRYSRITWLGDLSQYLRVPNMYLSDFIPLAHALTQKYGQPLRDAATWWPLLQFTAGNPLTSTVLVKQALHEGLQTYEQVAAFVAGLRTGEGVIDNQDSQRRSMSLRASLSYGFEYAFNEPERQRIALLHFFQRFVNADVLQIMGNSTADWSLVSVRGMSSESWMALLDRMSDLGLLETIGNGLYISHPALPWFLKSLFDQIYRGVSWSKTDATRAFVEAMSEEARVYYERYRKGNSDLIGSFVAEQNNYLYARQLAQAHGWWRALVSIMPALKSIYTYMGHGAEWASLMNEIVPDFCDPQNDGPLPGREDEWAIVIQYRAQLAAEAQQWSEAERLQKIKIDRVRQHATPNKRMLATSLVTLAGFLADQEKPECVPLYEEIIGLYQQIGDPSAEASAIFNLGNAYAGISSLHNWAKAKELYRQSLELRVLTDHPGRSACYSQLGYVEWARFCDEEAAGEPEEKIRPYLDEAEANYKKALDELQPVKSRPWSTIQAVQKLSTISAMLGNVCRDKGQTDNAVQHYREAIRLFTQSDDIFQAAATRFNTAIALGNAGRFQEALLYAETARQNFAEAVGYNASETQRALSLIEAIKGQLDQTGSEQHDDIQSV